MKRLIFMALMILGVIFMSLPFIISVDASTDPTVTISNTNITEKGKLNRLMNDIHSNIVDIGFDDGFNRFISGTSSANGTAVDYTITINKNYYNKLNQKAKQDVMSVALDTIDKSTVSKVNRVKIYNFVADMDKSTSNLVRQLSNDVDADFAGAYMTFKPFTGVVGWILGLICLSIFMFLAIGVTLDIAYISLPIVQHWLYNEEKKKAKFISIEAQKAVEVSAQSEGTNFVNPVGFYFKHKTKQFIAIAVCILYLVSGKIFPLVANIMDAFNGIVG